MARPVDKTHETAPWRVVGNLVDIYSRPKWSADQRSHDAHGWESNVVQVELKTLGINRRRAMEQIATYKNDTGKAF